MLFATFFLYADTAREKLLFHNSSPKRVLLQIGSEVSGSFRTVESLFILPKKSYVTRYKYEGKNVLKINSTSYTLEKVARYSPSQKAFILVWAYNSIENKKKLKSSEIQIKSLVKEQAKIERNKRASIEQINSILHRIRLIAHQANIKVREYNQLHIQRNSLLSRSPKNYAEQMQLQNAIQQINMYIYNTQLQIQHLKIQYQSAILNYQSLLRNIDNFHFQYNSIVKSYHYQYLEYNYRVQEKMFAEDIPKKDLEDLKRKKKAFEKKEREIENIEQKLQKLAKEGQDTMNDLENDMKKFSDLLD